MKIIKLVVLINFLTVEILAGQAPQNWSLLDKKDDGFNGVSSEKVFNTILKDKPGKPVIVAVIDSGVEVDHEDLKDNMWVNPGEIANNGIDDDKNGYIDDIHGWNFIGGKDGDVGADTYESVRIYASMRYKFENAIPEKLNKQDKKEYEKYLDLKNKTEKEIESAKSGLAQINIAEATILASLNAVAKKAEETQTNFSDILNADWSKEQEYAIAANILKEVIDSEPEISSIEDVKELILDEIEAGKKDFQNKLEYSYNPDFDPRKTIVKDNYNDSNERYYGNNNYEGPDATHGTHVAGIIGAVAKNGKGSNGIARNVRIMTLRAVPDGDERDKDVANAIKYAVDNGAKVINMSFGKAHSWDKKVVDEAVKYAEKRDVLMVHAAGNSGQDNDKTDNFPNDYLGKGGFLFFKKKKYAKNWIAVGALSPKDGEDMVAGFSNYGTTSVDVFSPGVQIYSTVPDNGYQNLQGTSMAAPAVAGVAAVIRSQYPGLTAEQVKDIIITSAVPYTGMVKKPGTKGKEKVAFNTLSVSGGMVNLEKALELASKTKGKNKVEAIRA